MLSRKLLIVVANFLLVAALPQQCAAMEPADPTPEALFQEAVAVAKTIDREDYRIIALEQIAALQARFGYRDAAAATYIETWRAIQCLPAGSNLSNWLPRLAKEQAQIGDLPAARQSAAGITIADMKNDAFAVIAEEEAAAGDLPAAINTADTIDIADYKHTALRNIARRRAGAKDFAGAAQATAKIDQPIGMANATAEIAKVRFQQGDKVLARNELRSARDIAANSKPQDDRARITKDAVLTRITGMQAEFGDLDEARKTAAGIEGAWKDAAYDAIAWAQAHGGDIDGAVRTLALVSKQSPHTLQEIARAHARKRNWAQAVQTVRSIDGDWRKAEGFLDIARLQAKAGDRKGMSESLLEALKSADTYANSESIVGGRAGLLQSIAAVQFELDEVDAGIATVTKIKELNEPNAPPNQNRHELSQAVIKAAGALAKQGKIRAAHLLADELEEEFYRMTAFQAIAQALTESGDARAALEWTKKFDQPIHKSMALAGVAEGLARRQTKEKGPTEKK